MIQIELNCPYEERQEVKNLGALFDKEAKTWYFTDYKRAYLYKRWLPDKKYMEIQSYKTASEFLPDEKERKKIANWLKKNGYIEDARTVTRKGMDIGILSTGADKKRGVLIYPQKAQDFILKHMAETPEENEAVSIKASEPHNENMLLEVTYTGPGKQAEIMGMKLTGKDGTILMDEYYYPYYADAHWYVLQCCHLTRTDLAKHKDFRQGWIRLKKLLSEHDDVLYIKGKSRFLTQLKVTLKAAGLMEAEAEIFGS